MVSFLMDEKDRRLYLAIFSNVSFLCLAAALSYFSYALLKVVDEIPEVKQVFVQQNKLLQSVSHELAVLEETFPTLIEESSLLRQQFDHYIPQIIQLLEGRVSTSTEKPTIKPVDEPPLLGADTQVENEKTVDLMALIIRHALLDAKVFSVEDMMVAENALHSVLQSQGDLAVPWSNPKTGANGMMVAVSESKSELKMCKKIRLLAMHKSRLRNNSVTEFCQAIAENVIDAANQKWQVQR